MIQINLAAVPNQEFSIQLDGQFYDIHIRDANGSPAATIVRDGVVVVSAARIVAGAPLLPYLYQENGNFLLTVTNDALPDWEQFGITQFLVYLTADELATLRAA